MRRRYFGIQTTWYSVRYTLWFETRLCTHVFYLSIASAAFHPRACPGNSEMAFRIATYPLICQSMIYDGDKIGGLLPDRRGKNKPGDYLLSQSLAG